MDAFDEKIKDALLSTPQDDLTYVNFGFHDFWSYDSDDIEKLYVGHENEIMKIINHAISVFKNKAPTRRVAIIAPSGTGKTTFSQVVERKLRKFRDLIDIQTSVIFHVKKTPRSILKEQLSIFRRLKNSMVVVDDMHEAFVGDVDIKNCIFNMLKEKIEGGLVITTWLPYGWAYAVSQMPELPQLFDDIIILTPPTKTECKKLVKLRFEHFSIRQHVDFEPFTESQIESTIDLCNRNPELILQIIMNAMNIAQKNKEKNITEEIIKKSTEILGILIDMNKNDLPESLRSTIKASLFQFSITADVVAEVLNQRTSRANYSVYLNKLKEDRYLEKCGHFPHNSKKMIFHMKPFLRHKLEQEIMEEVSVKLHSIDTQFHI